MRPDELGTLVNGVSISYVGQLTLNHVRGDLNGTAPADAPMHVAALGAD